jgi:cholera toxin transcriptional activator
MTEPAPARRYRFGAFEADASTGELRRQGIRVKLNAQPFQVLLMLLEHPGEVLTREEIARTLWSDGTFVDYDHGVNSAVNRIREALGDAATSPRFVETLARRGYRFVAPVESIATESAPSPSPVPLELPQESEPRPGNGILASLEELPRTSHAVVQSLFLFLQVMYLGFYVGALTNLAEIEDLLSPLRRATLVFYALIGTAAILIPVRAFVLCAVLFRAPGVRRKFLQMWPAILVADVLWSLSPFLLMHHINAGLALACMALLVYSPFAQRSLMLMGAGRDEAELSTATR